MLEWHKELELCVCVLHESDENMIQHARIAPATPTRFFSFFFKCVKNNNKTNGMVQKYRFFSLCKYDTRIIFLVDCYLSSYFLFFFLNASVHVARSVSIAYGL